MDHALTNAVNWSTVRLGQGCLRPRGSRTAASESFTSSRNQGEYYVRTQALYVLEERWRYGI
jgi:hypothetical protein